MAKAITPTTHGAASSQDILGSVSSSSRVIEFISKPAEEPVDPSSEAYREREAAARREARFQEGKIGMEIRFIESMAAI